MSESTVNSEEDSFSKSNDALPAAPEGGRWFSLGGLAIVGLAAWIVAFLLLPRAEFALIDGPPEQLGSLQTANLQEAGSWVKASGTPKGAALSFRRMGSSGSYRLTRAQERPSVWLLLRVPDEIDTGNPDAYVPPTHFVGRLTRLEDAGLILRPVRRLIEKQVGDSTNDYLLIDGASPKSHRPSLLAAVLLALLGAACLSFGIHLCRAPGSLRPTS